jgi:hypothetical protein
MSRKIVSSPPTVINILITTHGNLPSIQTYGSRSNSKSQNISTVENLKIDPSSSLKLNRVNLDETAECSRIPQEDMHDIIRNVEEQYRENGSIISEGLVAFLNSQQDVRKDIDFNRSQELVELYSQIGKHMKKPSRLTYKFAMRPHSDSSMVINKVYDWNTDVPGVMPFLIYTSDIELKFSIFNAIYDNTKIVKTLFILIKDILKVCEQAGITNIELNIIDTSCNALTGIANAKMEDTGFSRIPKGGKKRKRTRRKVRKGTKRRRKTIRRN